jgi:leucyl aminopeptidase (aminopeptidase T)
MDPRAIAMMETAVKPYRAIGKAGEKVVIIADTITDPAIWETFAMAAQTMGIEPMIALMVPTRRDYENPPEPVQKMAEAADIIHFTTRQGLIHSKFGRELSRSGKKRIISEGVEVEMFTEGAALADEEEVKEWIEKIQTIWDNGKSVKLTSEAGTDLDVSIEGHYSFVTAGAQLFKAPSAQFPGGESACTPAENSGDGIIVVDKAIHYPHGRLMHPIELSLRGGKIVEIRGGYEADEFRWWTDSYADEEGKTICELSVGCNPMAKFMGSMRQDRFVLGSFHVGFGMNADVGGNIVSNIHYDAVIGKPTLVVDGKKIIEKGSLLI